MGSEPGKVHELSTTERETLAAILHHESPVTVLLWGQGDNRRASFYSQGSSLEARIAYPTRSPADAYASTVRAFVHHARQEITQSDHLGGNEAELRHLKEAVRDLVILAEYLVPRLEQLA